MNCDSQLCSYGRPSKAIFKDVGIKFGTLAWVGKYALREEDPQLSILSTDLAKAAADKVIALPYFGSQKRWVLTVMRPRPTPHPTHFNQKASI